LVILVESSHFSSDLLCRRFRNNFCYNAFLRPSTGLEQAAAVSLCHEAPGSRLSNQSALAWLLCQILVFGNGWSGFIETDSSQEHR
jgi:hypothetical protein